MKKLLVLALLLLTATASWAQEHGLNKQQVSLLKGLGTSVAAPLFIPDGFKVSKVIATAAQRGKSSYRIIYSSRDRKGFVVESVSGDIGSPEADRIIPVRNPVYGDTFVGVYVFDGQRSTAGDWLGEGPYVRVRDADDRHADEKRLHSGLSPETMAKIHASLVPIR